MILKTNVKICIFSFLILFLLFLYGCNVGEATKTLKLKISNTVTLLPAAPCNDTDGGINPNVFGVVYYSNESLARNRHYRDTCSTDRTRLSEWYCDRRGNAVNQIIDCPSGKVCDQGECVSPDKTYICGNGICENARERYNGCTYDCPETVCKGVCTEHADVYCGCNTEEYRLIRSIVTCKSRVSCDSCGEQSGLFGAFANVQNQVYNCLSNYFGYYPSRIPNMVINDETEEPCSNRGGCGYIQPIKPRVSKLVSWNLPGNRSYNQNHPTSGAQLLAEKHEATHYYLYRMLHSIPGWFDEGVAIQTQERLHCSPQEDPNGDAYLQEREEAVGVRGGITMGDGTHLNADFYRRLKRGETHLIGDLGDRDYESHSVGALWIIGLKEDYNCTENCLRDIVNLLKQEVDRKCRISQEQCGIARQFVRENFDASCSTSPGGTLSGGVIIKTIDTRPGTAILQPKSYWFFWDGSSFSWSVNNQVNPSVSNAMVLNKTNQVVGRDTTPLFNLLGIDIIS